MREQFCIIIAYEGTDSTDKSPLILGSVHKIDPNEE
jgi:hypothetical protein